MSGAKQISVNPGAYPVLRIALIYSSGVVIGRHLPAAVPFLPLTVCVMVLSVICLAIPHFKTAAGRFHALPVLYLFCIAGFGVVNTFLHHKPSTPGEHLLEVFPEDDIIFYGSVTSDRSTRSGNRLLRVAIDSAGIRNLPTWKHPFTTEVLMRMEHTDSKNDDFCSPSPSAGSYLQFHGDLRRPQPPGNPNQFDYAAFLERQGIYSQIFISDLISCSQDPATPFWVQQQRHMQQALARLFSDANTPLARAIILGDRSELDHELRTAFSRAGLAHLMAVSGMHVGFILLPVWYVLPWFRGSPSARATALFLGGTLLLFYAGITGFSISVSRASLMSFFLIFARLYHKPGTSMNILGSAAFILLVMDPLMLFDVGFQLSFTAVAIILTTLPGTRYLLPATYRYNKAGALFQFVMVSILVQGGLYPILMYYFQEFSIAGPISNTLAVPFVQLMFLWSFFCLGAGFFHASIASIINIPGDVILTGLTRYVNWIGTQPASWIEGAPPGYLLFGIWFFAIAILASMRLPAIRWKMLCGLLLFLTLAQAERFVNKRQSPELQVTFFDVGQGDAVLLQTPGGLHYLYDTGIWTPHFDSGERTLIPELKAMGINRLDGIILSHPHADHIGGIISLIKEIPIDTIYQSPREYDSALYHRYMSLASDMQIPIRLLTAGDKILTDTSMPMLVLSPSDNITANDPNNLSVVVKVVYGSSALMLSGDAEEEAEIFMAETFGRFLHSDLLKVGHHASRTSSTAEFLEYVSPRKGVASLAEANRYSHPHAQATARLRKADVKTRFTSLEGAVIYRSDGSKFQYVPWRREVPNHNVEPVEENPDQNPGSLLSNRLSKISYHLLN